MAVTLLTFLTRKDGLTAAEFQDHFESKYVPLLKEKLGSNYPAHTTRKYVKRLSDGGAAVIAGRDSDFTYDVLFEAEFLDKDSFETYLKAYNDDVVKAIGEEETKFSDPTKTRAVVLSGSIRD
jgi:hypothetical protein